MKNPPLVREANIDNMVVFVTLDPNETLEVGTLNVQKQLANTTTVGMALTQESRF